MRALVVANAADVVWTRLTANRRYIEKAIHLRAQISLERTARCLSEAELGMGRAELWARGRARP